MRTTLLILLALCACRSDQVGPIDIQQSVDGAPMRVVTARGQMSTLVGLGSGSTTITGREDKNAAAGVFEVRVDAAVPEGTEMASRAICRVGDWTIAQPLTWNGGLGDTPVGQTKEFYAQYMPSPIAAHAPSACEFSSWYGSMGIRPNTLRIEPTRLATVCWTPDAIVEGECGADLLPREPDTDGEPIAIPALVAAFSKTDKGDHTVGFAYLVTMNERPAAHSRIIGRMSCDVAGKTVEQSANTLTMFDHLVPGESVAGNGTAFSTKPLADAPDRCTLDLRLSAAPGDEGTSIAMWCIEPDGTEPGACE